MRRGHEGVHDSTGAGRRAMRRRMPGWFDETARPSRGRRSTPASLLGHSLRRSRTERSPMLGALWSAHGAIRRLCESCIIGRELTFVQHNQVCVPAAVARGMPRADQSRRSVAPARSVGEAERARPPRQHAFASIPRRDDPCATASGVGRGAQRDGVPRGAAALGRRLRMLLKFERWRALTTRHGRPRAARGDSRGDRHAEKAQPGASE